MYINQNELRDNLKDFCLFFSCKFVLFLFNVFQAYYLCYSLLTLANEALNFQFFPAQQKVHYGLYIFRCTIVFMCRFGVS